MCNSKNIIISIVANLLFISAAMAGPGDSRLPIGGFGQESNGIGYSTSSSNGGGNYSITSDPGPPPPPPPIPIDGGVVAILVGGLLIGGRRLLKGVVRK